MCGFAISRLRPAKQLTRTVGAAVDRNDASSGHLERHRDQIKVYQYGDWGRHFFGPRMLSKFSVARLTFKKEKVMNINPHAQGIASVLRAEIEAWRRAGNVSREAVAIQVMDAHQQLGGEAATGVDFSFAGDAYTQAKKGAQKLFRWLDVDGTLPANMVQSILAALPDDVRLHCMNQMFCPLGVEVRTAGCGQPAGLDVSKHLRAVMKEGGEAQMALLNLSPDASDADLLAAHKELIEAAQACENAACDAMAKVVARQTLAKASA